MVEEAHTNAPAPGAVPMDDERRRTLEAFKKKMIEYKEVEARLKTLRMEERELERKYEKSENDIKALQSVGQIVGEVLKQLTEDKCELVVLNPLHLSPICSHCQGDERAALCGRLSPQYRQEASEARDARVARHDHAHDHAVGPFDPIE